VGRDPTSIALRQQLLAEGQALAGRFTEADGRLVALAGEVDARIGEAVATINRTTTAIARLNESIVAAGPRAPLAMLDERDALIRDLARQIDVSVAPQPDGSLAVFAGTGQSLVQGTRAQALAVQADPLQRERLVVGVDQGGAFLDITNRIAGGALGGLVAFRRDSLDPARAQLGQIALGLGATVNARQQDGLDLNGLLGRDFFRVAPPAVGPATTNTGTAVVTVAVADPAAVAARDYEFRFGAGSWTLFDRATGAVVPTTGTGTVADPFVADGLALSVAGTPAAGDRFLVRPLANTAASLRVELTDAAGIAAAAPLRAAGAAANLGTATISRPVADDPGNPQLLASVEVRFASPTTYQLFTPGGTALGPVQAYASGGDISLNGWTVQVSGTPRAGDVFTVRSSGAGSGDNTNAVALAGAGSAGYFRGGLQSLTDAGADLVGTVGAAAARAAAEREAQATVATQAELDVESVAGVNLEEEAAALLRYQQAYQAAAKVVAVGDELFRILLDSVR
jgi:flagellar hook-associated protein 1 FlgK